LDLKKKKKDYSSNEKWRGHLKSYALSQLDYPEGVGLKRSLAIKRMTILSGIPLWEASPELMEELINELRKEYSRLKRREESGERIGPDRPDKRRKWSHTDVG
tara:strand:+ start:1959 stop:2267 length:309 start_codon:yes stop_codon:yes gene_type:complete